MGTNTWRIRAAARMQMALCMAAAGSAGFGANTAHGSGAILYVDASAPGGGDGRSWQGAFSFLTDALADADADLAVVEIHIAQGRYVPDQSHAVPGGTGDRAASFEVRSGLALIGGFAGIGSGDPNAWDPELYESVLNGDLAGNDDPQTGLGRDENAWTVVHRAHRRDGL